MKNNTAIAYVRIHHELDHECIRIRDTYVKQVEQYCKENNLRLVKVIADRHDVNCQCPSWLLISLLKELVNTFTEAKHFVSIDKHHLGRSKKETKQVLRMLKEMTQVHLIKEL